MQALSARAPRVAAKPGAFRRKDADSSRYGSSTQRLTSIMLYTDQFACVSLDLAVSRSGARSAVTGKTLSRGVPRFSPGCLALGQVWSLIMPFLNARAVVCKATTVRSEVAKKVAMLSTLPATLAAHPAFALVRMPSPPDNHANRSAITRQIRRSRSWGSEHVSAFCLQVDERMNGDGTGRPFGVNDPVSLVIEFKASLGRCPAGCAWAASLARHVSFSSSC